MPFTFGAKSLKNMEGVDPRLVKLAHWVIARCPVDFGVPFEGGWRVLETQQRLYRTGLSGCDGVDKVSPHQLGKALDVFPYVNGKADYDKEYVCMIAAWFLQGAIILGYKIKWGGTFTTRFDGPHFELME